VDQPFQNLMRYELLLKAIQKELINAGYVPTEDASDLIMQSIENIVPEVKNINKYKEVVHELNKIDAVLLDLIALEVSADFLSEIEESDKNEKIKHLEAVHFVVMNEKNKIAQGDGDDVHDFFKALLGLLREMDSKYVVKSGMVSRYMSYTASGAYYMLATVPSSLFSSSSVTTQQVSPVERLRNCILELEVTIQQTEVIRELFKK